MSFFRQFSARRWLLIPLCAVLFAGTMGYARWRQVERISAIGRDGQDGVGRHWLIAPEHHTRTAQWLLETELMLTTGEWRIRQTPFENAPAGRAVHSASPYRWWLGALAWTDHRFSGRPLSQSVERAALWSGPLLHLMLVLGATIFAARRFGSGTAALIAVGLTVLYPLAGEFQPGVADDHGIAIAAAWASVLFIAAGLQGDRRAFALAGIAGGLGLWLDVGTQAPVLAGIGGGSLMLSAFGRRKGAGRFSNTAGSLPWNIWALAGSLTCLAGYLVEYYPDHMELQLRANHPLYALAWTGLGALLTLTEAWRNGRAGFNRPTFLAATIALVGIAGVAVAVRAAGSASLLAAGPDASRLTSLLKGAVFPNFATWLTREGPLLAKVAVCLPLFLLAPVTMALLSREPDNGARRTTLFLAGPLFVCVALACAQLQAWALAQLVLLTVVATVLSRPDRRVWLAVAVCLLPSGLELLRSARMRDETELTRLEAESLRERDLAHWIADHSDAPSTVVLAAPDSTPGLCFYGGLRGLASPSWENPEGLAATVRILSATTSDEALGLLNQRGITHVILAAGDTELDEFVRWATNKPDDTFLTALRRWALPPWVQPSAYRPPVISGLEGASPVILRITENTDRALALSRLAEYALETQDAAMAASINDTLKTYPTNLGALIGRAQIEKARGDTAAFDPVFATIQQNLSNRLDRLLPWDRRVSLAVVLALGGRNDLAKPQVQRCLAELDEARVRSLDEGSLYRLLLLSRNLDVPVPKPALRELALSLLPEEMRTKLSPPSS